MTDEEDENADAPIVLPSDAIGLFSEAGLPKYLPLVLAALSSLPWVGGLLGFAAAVENERRQGRTNRLHEEWLDEHQKRLIQLQQMLEEIARRLDAMEASPDRVASPDFGAIARQAFRTWDTAESEEKRVLVQRVLTNAAATELSSDDVVRMFLDWINRYHELHFSIIAAIQRSLGATRASIWSELRGTTPREDSADADLFRLLFRDLSTGGVIRQHRAVDYAGKFVKKQPKRSPPGGADTRMKSAFDDDDQYELTALGRDFVHYALSDTVLRFGTAENGSSV